MVHPAHITRLVDGRICAYGLTSGGVLAPAAVFRSVGDDEVVEHTVTADLRQAVYTTVNAVVCVADSGDEVWRRRFEPRSEERYGHRPGCLLSRDGAVVWIYLPNVMARRGLPDQWVALDAGTGMVIDQVDLPTAGHGGQQFTHPGDGHVLLDVGEGQDGSVTFRATLADGEITLTRYPWTDRALMSLSPDGGHFMTIDQDQGDVAFHAYPGGEVTLRLPVEAFGQDPAEVFVDWSGGYLISQSALVTLTGETEDDDEWLRSYRVDTRTGGVDADFDGHAAQAYDIECPGDGSWLTTDASGHPARWLAEVRPG